MTPSLPPSFMPGPADFVTYGRALLIGQNAFGALAIARERGYERAERILKSAVEAGSTSDANWASALMDHRIAANGFVDSLRTASAFDALFPSMRRIPMAQKAAVVTVAASGSASGEMHLKPVTRLSLAEVTLEVKKSVAIVVISNELARSAGAAGDALLSRELRGAVGAATDQLFLSEIAAGAATITSSGSDALAVHADVGAQLAAVSIGATSRLYLIVSPSIAGQISAKATTTGGSAFGEMTPQGGMLCGIPVIVAGLEDDSGGGTMLLVDADGIGADMGTITLDTSTVATIAMDNDPDSGAEQATTSLFQSNSSALRAERYFAFQKLRATAVAKVEGVDYSGAT